MTASLSVLLDLSVLSAPTLSRGMGRYVTSLATALYERANGDPELRVFATAERPWLRTPEVSEDIPRLLDDLTQTRRRGGRRAGGGRALSKAVKRCGAQVVHSLDPLATPLSELPCKRVVTCHHLESGIGAQSWHGSEASFSRTERDRFYRADRVIAASRATAQELIARLDLPRDRISVVPHGVSMRRWAAQPQADEEGRLVSLSVKDRPYLLCVGAVDERKNVEGVFQGLGRARRLIGREDLVVVWAGRLDKSERQRLMQKANEAGLSDAVVTAGYVSDADLAALYRHATALVFASRREGFGYPVVEAMAAGCPVVTSNCSSLVEVADDAALTVDPEDAGAIADAIVLLADDNAERRHFSEMGRERAQEFSLKKMTAGTVNVYRSVAGFDASGRGGP